MQGGAVKCDRSNIINMATYRVVLHPSDEGYSVSCPGLPGCWSQGATEEEALANIRDAIHDYLEVAKELAGERNLREVEVPVWRCRKYPESHISARLGLSKRPVSLLPGKASTLS